VVYFGGFFARKTFRGVFSKYHYFVVRISEAAMCGEHYIYIWVPRSSFIRDGEIEEGGVWIDLSLFTVYLT
jgi:hypothetical protein